jgi:hypothetical protein
MTKQTLLRLRADHQPIARKVDGVYNGMPLQMNAGSSLYTLLSPRMVWTLACLLHGGTDSLRADAEIVMAVLVHAVVLISHEVRVWGLPRLPVLTGHGGQRKPLSLVGQRAHRLTTHHRAHNSLRAGSTTRGSAVFPTALVQLHGDAAGGRRRNTTLPATDVAVVRQLSMVMLVRHRTTRLPDASGSLVLVRRSDRPLTVRPARALTTRAREYAFVGVWRRAPRFRTQRTS